MLVLGYCSSISSSTEEGFFDLGLSSRLVSPSLKRFVSNHRWQFLNFPHSFISFDAAFTFSPFFQRLPQMALIAIFFTTHYQRCTTNNKCWLSNAKSCFYILGGTMKLSPKKRRHYSILFNENRFSFFVADHILVGQLCTSTKSDRSLLSCLKVTQCSTSEIGDAPLFSFGRQFYVYILNI